MSSSKNYCQNFSLVLHTNSMCMHACCNSISMHAYTIIGSPLPPDLKVDISQNGSLLTLSWDEPFTFVGYNVTRYSLRVTNRSQMDTTLQEDIDIGLNRIYSLHTPKRETTVCHELVFVVNAFSKVGTSRGEIIGGFPIGEKSYFQICLHV